jgi:multisubunit Na+/H+ antiporter MnhB subunit
MKKRKIYEVWQNYDNFIRSLHLKSLEEQRKDRKKRFINYLIKLLIIFIASFLTTATFQFLINPNGLFNSGINGIIQVIVTYFFSKKNINNTYFPATYYTSVLFVNIIIVSVVDWFYPDNIEMNSTAIFYVLFQFIWSSIFKYTTLQNYIFNRFSPNTWSYLSNNKQLGLTLPFYITIGIISSMIHTFGYRLIYQAKSTPGGLEVITSTLSQNEGTKKNKISIGYLTKIFGIFVIFSITLFNFTIVENDIDVKRNKIINFINIYMEKEDEKIHNWNEATNFINDWINNEKSNSFNNEIEKKKHSLTSEVFKKWTGDNLDDPSDVLYYLEDNRSLLKHLRAKYSDSKNEKQIAKLRELEDNTYDRNILGYFKYVTNNEKLWASLVYIFFSSYLINQFFPKNTLVFLNAKIENENNLESMLDILKNHNPAYFKAFVRNKKIIGDVYFLNCSITKWNYQLLSSELGKFGEISISALDESN